MRPKNLKDYKVIDCENYETIGIIKTDNSTIKSAITDNARIYSTTYIIYASITMLILLLLSFMGGRAFMKSDVREMESRLDSLSAKYKTLLIQNDELANFCTNEKLHTAIGRFSMINEKYNTEPTIDSIYSILVSIDAWYPEYIVAQAVIESGHFTSEIYRTNNNLFGMKQVSKRSTTQTGKRTNKPTYGHYENWQLSVIDRVLLDMHNFSQKPTREEYEKSLTKYAEDPEYISKLKNNIKRN